MVVRKAGPVMLTAARRLIPVSIRGDLAAAMSMAALVMGHAVNTAVHRRRVRVEPATLMAAQPQVFALPTVALP